MVLAGVAGVLTLIASQIAGSVAVNLSVILGRLIGSARNVALTCVAVTAYLISPAACAQRATGALFVDPAVYRSIPLGIAPSRGPSPDRVDLSADFPEPGDQGQQASCVGWAVGYLKSYQERIERRWTLADPSHQFSPAFIYNQIKVGYCDSGAYVPDALGLLHERGALSIQTFPYSDRSCDQQPNALELREALPFGVGGFRTVNVQDIAEVKRFLASGYPIVVATIVDAAFRRWQSTDLYPGNSGDGGGHAMVVVGYDDSRQAFRLINSWGKNRATMRASSNSAASTSASRSPCSRKSMSTGRMRPRFTSTSRKPSRARSVPAGSNGTSRSSWWIARGMW